MPIPNQIHNPAGETTAKRIAPHFQRQLRHKVANSKKFSDRVLTDAKAAFFHKYLVSGCESMREAAASHARMVEKEKLWNDHASEFFKTLPFYAPEQLPLVIFWLPGTLFAHYRACGLARLIELVDKASIFTSKLFASALLAEQEKIMKRVNAELAGLRKLCDSFEASHGQPLLRFPSEVSARVEGLARELLENAAGIRTKLDSWSSSPEPGLMHEISLSVKTLAEKIKDFYKISNDLFNELYSVAQK
ncbi:Uncharacterised protein [Candidatus Burarchaeum australiense]|nr:Uncharacterised protein [Candidatus Burarchaeum australiense]